MQFFFRHELLKDYDYYWRIEYVFFYQLALHIIVILAYNALRRPSIKLFCDIDYDPFLLMQDGKKVYGGMLIKTAKHLLSFCY
jgi:alpha 1,2-mannosyltransferase